MSQWRNLIQSMFGGNRLLSHSIPIHPNKGNQMSKQEKTAKAQAEKQAKPDKFAGKFEFLEHTADVYVRAYGERMWDAYETRRWRC
jgi:hypothetical protein